MTLVNWLIIVAGVFLIGYIAVMVYTRWCSMTDELHHLREEVRELKSGIEPRIRLVEEKFRLYHDSIYKSLADLQENIERLQEWQLRVDKIVTDYNIASQKLQELQKQQALYPLTQRNATRRRKR